MLGEQNCFSVKRAYERRCSKLCGSSQTLSEHLVCLESFAEKAEPNVARGLKGVWFDDAVFPTAGMLRDGYERPSFDRLVAEARRRLDAGAFAVGWAEKAQRCRLMKLSRRPLAIALPREILRQSKA